MKGHFSTLPDEILENILEMWIYSLPKREGSYHSDKDPLDHSVFKDFLVMCQVNTRIRNHIRSSVDLNTLLLTWSANKRNEMIPLWVSKLPSQIVCGLLTEVILINNYFGQLPFVETSNIAPLFKQCRNLKSVKIRECVKYSLPELMVLLHDYEDIVCDLDMLELNPPHSIKGGWGYKPDRDGSKAWAEAMSCFKQIFQARNQNFFLNPEVCSCGKGVLRRRGKRYADTAWRKYCEIICDRCDMLISECCRLWYKDLEKSTAIVNMAAVMIMLVEIAQRPMLMRKVLRSSRLVSM
jgi:hypothetical protein